MASKYRVRLATANIQALPLMDQDFVEVDLNVMANLSGLLCLQEIGPARYKKAVEELRGFNPYNLETEVPLAIRQAPWKVLQEGKRLITEGIGGLTPNRYVSWALVGHRVSGELLILNNTHYINRAFGNHPQDSKAEQALRRKLWLKGNAIHKNMIKDWRARNFPILGGGDFNRLNYPVLGEDINYHVWGGLDYLYSIDSRYVKFSTLKEDRVDLQSDHPGKVARLEMSVVTH